MAIYGLKYLAWAPTSTEPENAIPTYGTGTTLGRMVSMNVSVNNSEGSLYADDALAEYVAEFTDATCTIAVDNITLENQSKLFGATYDSDSSEFTMKATDTPPTGGIVGYQVVINNGVKAYRGWFYPKFKASIPNEDVSTKGESISFGTMSIEGKIMSPKYGPWCYKKEFASESDCKTWCNGKLGIS